MMVPLISPDLAVVPILIGPLQVLIAVLPAILAAIGGALLAMLKPSAMLAGVRILWRNKIAAIAAIAVITGAVYLVRIVTAHFGHATSAAVVGRDWPVMRGSADRRAWSGEGGDPVSGGVAWSFAREFKTFYASPAVVGNRVYISSADKGVFADRGAIYCLDADNGAVVWKYAPGNFRATYSSPSVSGKYVVCGEGLHVTRDARISCLDAGSGAKLWDLRTHSHVESSPCIAGDRVFVGAGDDGLYAVALAPKGGQANVLWHLDGAKYPDCETSPIWEDGKVYFGLGENGCGLVCVNADNGAEVWRIKAPYPVFSAPVLSDGKLYIAMGNGNMIETAEAVREKRLQEMRAHGKSDAEIAEAAKGLGRAGEVWCLNPANGSAIWKHKVPDTVLGVIAAVEGRIYFGCRDGVFRCLTADGDVAYEFDAHEPIVTSAAVARDCAYFVTESGRLYAVDRLKGRSVWQAAVGTVGPFLSSPAVGRGHVYVGTAEDGFLCVGQATGADVSAPVWAGYLGGPGKSGWMDGSMLPLRGNFAWRWPGDSDDTNAVTMIAGPPACADGMLFVAGQFAGRTGLVALASAGEAGKPGDAKAARKKYEQKWLFESGLSPRGSPAVGNGAVYFSDGEARATGRKLYCVDEKTGALSWSKEIDPDASGEFLLTSHDLYACCTVGSLSRFSAKAGEGGKRVWTAPVGTCAGMPAVAGDIVLTAVVSPPGITAVRAGDGSILWRCSLADVPLGGPVSGDDVALAVTARGLFGLSLVNGGILWSLECKPSGAPIVCDDNRVAVTTADGAIVVADWRGRDVLRLKDAAAAFPPMLCGDKLLYAKPGAIQRVELPSGTETRWLATEWLGAMATPPVLSDGSVYFGTAAKGIVCARAAR